jgi:hypothetical protein
MRAFMRLYSRLQPIDFSRHVLQKIPQRILLHPMRDVHWSDWGRPERIIETIERIGAEPAFNQGRLQVWRRSSNDASETPAASVTPEYWLNL